MAFPAKLADLDDDQAIAEIASGSFLKHIAARYGVAKQSLHERLKKHPAWRAAIEMQAETLVESATSEAMGLDSSATMPDIARARVKVDTAHKWAAARDSANWGQKQQVQIDAAITVHVMRVGAGDAITIDATPVAGTPAHQITMRVK